MTKQEELIWKKGRKSFINQAYLIIVTDIIDDGTIDKLSPEEKLERIKNFLDYHKFVANTENLK